MSILTDEFFRLKAKMCRKYRCKNCPLSKHRNSQHLTCSTLERENPEKALEIVKKWNEKMIDMEIVKQWRGMKKELNNIKSKFIATIVTIALVIMVLFFVGCDNTNNSAKADNSVFITVSCTVKYQIVYDKETKVMYIMSDGCNNAGSFTMMVNADGTPKLYKGE